MVESVVFLVRRGVSGRGADGWSSFSARLFVRVIMLRLHRCISLNVCVCVCVCVCVFCFMPCKTLWARIHCHCLWTRLQRETRCAHHQVLSEIDEPHPSKLSSNGTTVFYSTAESVLETTRRHETKRGRNICTELVFATKHKTKKASRGDHWLTDEFPKKQK